MMEIVMSENGQYVIDKRVMLGMHWKNSGLP